MTRVNVLFFIGWISFKTFKIALHFSWPSRFVIDHFHYLNSRNLHCDAISTSTSLSSPEFNRFSYGLPPSVCHFRAGGCRNHSTAFEFIDFTAFSFLEFIHSPYAFTLTLSIFEPISFSIVISKIDFSSCFTTIFLSFPPDCPYDVPKD